MPKEFWALDALSFELGWRDPYDARKETEAQCKLETETKFLVLSRNMPFPPCISMTENKSAGVGNV